MSKKKKTVLGLYVVCVGTTESQWHTYSVMVIAPNAETAEWLALSRVANIHIIKPGLLKIVVAPELITVDFKTVGAIHSEYAGE